MNMEYLRTGAEGDLAAIFSRCYFSPDEASAEDKQRFLWSYGRWLHMIQAMYRQYLDEMRPTLIKGAFYKLPDALKPEGA